MSRGRKFTNEFKEESVKLALSSGQPIAKIANELGISKTTFYGWVKAGMNKKTEISQINSPSSRIKSLEEELKQLKKLLKRTEQERDILKKAAAYFAIQDL